MPLTRRTSAPVWRVAFLLALLAALVAATLEPAAVAAPKGGSKAPRGASATLTVSRAEAVAGQRVVLSGRLPAARRSGARLERRAGEKWVTVARRGVSASGGFRFDVRAQRRSTTYRVRTASGDAVIGRTSTPVRIVQSLGKAGNRKPVRSRTEAGVPADGDVAGTAVATASAGDPAALVDASAATTWSAPAAGSWLQVAWPKPRTVTTVALTGAATGARLAAATLVFSDGSTVPLGAVLPDAARPTAVSFRAKTVSWVRVQVDRTTGSGPLTLGDLAVYERGAPPRTVAGAASQPASRPAPACDPAATADAPLVVLCPTYGASVGRSAKVLLRGARPFTAVTAEAWSADGTSAVGTTRSVRRRANGAMSLRLDLSALPAGPLTVRLTAKGRQVGSATVLTQLRKRGAVPRSSRSSRAAAGRALVFAEDFDSPLSTSRTGVGADYSSSKPEFWGGADFGSAIFADPSMGLGNLQTQGGLLRMSAMPRPTDVADPQKWGREHVGAMLASARPGGSGFSAQHGYFEARMLVPAGAGTWPAFWLLPNPNLVAEQPVVAEIDALEHYGQNPQGTCHTSHQYPDPTGIGVARCADRWDDERGALAWHTYGVDVRPDRLVYYIDGRKVASAPQVGGGDQPMFWMVDMSLGGGWPIDLAGTLDRADTYVDWVRVYV